MTCRWMDYFYGQKANMTGLRVTPQEDSGIYGQFEQQHFLKGRMVLICVGPTIEGFKHDKTPFTAY